MKNEFSVQECLKEIESTIKNIKTNEEYIKFMKFQSKFHNYSYYNQILIYLQKPDSSFVCGFCKWKDLGRGIKKGEKSIKIFAPFFYKDKENEDEIKKYFKLISVFDISQTDGGDDKLPTIVKGLQNSSSDLQNLLNLLISKISVEFKNLNTRKGFYDIQTQKIILNSDNSDMQNIKTLLHEYSHHLHLSKYFNDENKDICEIIAESVAYIVCEYLNIDVSSYSINYLKLYNADNNIKKAGEKIQKIANEIINVICQKEAA